MRLLVLCFPTWGRGNQLHLTSAGNLVVLAPDELLRQLVEAGWTVEAVSMAERTELRLHRSALPLRAVDEVDFSSYDLYWHMFRDPTQPEVLERLAARRFDYRGRPVINDAFKLQHHRKDSYLKTLARYELAPRIVEGADTAGWTRCGDALISPDRRLIETHACNNNRGDYPERGAGRIVTEYIDNSRGGLRSIVRFGVAFGQGFAGYRYYSDAAAFRSGGARSWEPWTAPPALRERLAAALAETGCDVCHVEAVSRGEELCVFDVNPYPTADGQTLSEITRSLVAVIRRRFGDPE